jgi:hypothetical protein
MACGAREALRVPGDARFDPGGARSPESSVMTNRSCERRRWDHLVCRGGFTAKDAKGAKKDHKDEHSGPSGESVFAPFAYFAVKTLAT